jgi:hypothetical protein
MAQNKAKLCKFFIITLDFEKNANFSPKIGVNMFSFKHVACFRLNASAEKKALKYNITLIIIILLL